MVGVHELGSDEDLEVTDVFFCNIIGVMGIDACKCDGLLLVLTVLCPSVGVEDTIVCLVSTDMSASLNGGLLE